MLSSRSEVILKLIVNRYINTAVPVPSQSLASECGLRVSSATIRNEMARLEQEGYIIRPYSSAASVPSEKGYRYYVESLADIELPIIEQRMIDHLFHQVEKQQNEWLSLAAAVAAQLVRNMAVVSMPKSADCQLKHIEIISLQDLLALLVLVLHGARVKEQLITFDQAVSQPQLTTIANKLNASYAGLNKSQILTEEVNLSDAEKHVRDCLTGIMEAEDKREYEEPHLEGWHFILHQPEFAHSRQMLDLMELVEHKELLKNILPEALPNREVRVVIGKENRTEVIHNCSVVISRYGFSEDALGMIGIIGPTRMPYGRAISTVKHLASVLTELIAELYGKQRSN
ncbi:heat-inducible transcriptional repressor HrcA [Chloroflexota bacterium]